MKKVLTLLFCFTLICGYSQNKNKKKKKETHKIIVSGGHSSTSRNDSTRVDHGSIGGDLELKASQKKKPLNNKRDIRKLSTRTPNQRKTQKAKVEVRGWNPKNKKTTPKSIRDAGKTIGAGDPPQRASKKAVKFKAGQAQANYTNRKLQQGVKLINTYPKNNALFNTINDIKEFTWQLIGNHTQQRYKIELTKMKSGKNKDVTNSAITNSSGIKARKVVKFKAGSALAHSVNRTTNIKNSYCAFKWRVIELQTGISSSYFYFKIKNCTDKSKKNKRHDSMMNTIRNIH